MRNTISAIAALVILFGSAAINAAPTKAPAAPVVDDPTAWTPPADVPQLRMPLSAAEYQTRFDAAIKNIPGDEYGGGPFAGAIIRDVTVDSQADELSLQVGDVLVSIDGNPIRGAADVNLIRAANTRNDEQLIKIWSSAESRYRLVNVKPGMIGIADQTLMRPDLLLVQSTPAGQKPSPEMMVAALTVTADPDLCASALCHVRTQGDTNPLFDLLAAEVARSQGRPEEALVFCDRALKSLPADVRWTAAATARAAAIASFHWKAAIELDDKYKFLAPGAESPECNVLRNMYDQFKAMPPQRMANPVEEFDRLKVTDCAGHLTDEFVQQELNSFYTKAFNDRGSTSFADPGDDANLSNNALTGPFGANVDFSATVHFKASNDRKTGNPKSISFSIATPNAASKLIRLSVHDDGVTQIDGDPAIPTIQYDLKSQIENDRAFKIRMTVVGAREEVIVNGKRLYYGPMLPPESSRQLCVFMMNTCSEGEVSDYRWRIAGSRDK